MTVLAVWLWCSPGTDLLQAGCGDYLLPPQEISRHQTVPEELVASGAALPHHPQPPCRGRNCRRNPVQPLSMPVPSTIIVVVEHWADLREAPTTEPPQVNRRVRPDIFVAGPELIDRLDRPPRA